MAGTQDPDYPVIAGQDGIKLKPEKMLKDKLYSCVYDDRVFLFFKDESEMLQCYEINEPSAVKEILANPEEIENILKKRSQIKD